jgi:ferric-dicitrate binding protein FerR (iron transport regulator)
MSQITLTADTLTTVPSGTFEYDGTAAYVTTTSSQRGVILSDQFILQQGAYTLTSQTAAQKLFNPTTNGTVTLTAGTYAFDCAFSLSSMSASSGSFGFALGGGATFTQYWWADAQKGTATVATATATQSTYNVAANTTLATASVNTVGYAKINGVLVVTVGGTLIPQVSLGVAAAAVVGIGSYFRIRPLGSSSVTNVGNWS